MQRGISTDGNAAAIDERREPHRERRAGARGRPKPDRATVTLGDLTHDGEAQARASLGPGRGRITRMLWISYAALVIWTIAYLYLHIHEFIAFP